jgi:hypothetical protein
MKTSANNIYAYVSFFLLNLLIVSCELAEMPPSLITDENFYKTAQDAEAGLNAAYNGVAQLMFAGHITADFSADQSYPRPVVGRNTLTLFTYDVQYSNAGQPGESPASHWSNLYIAIEKANWVIEKVPSISMNAQRRDEIVGEALFLRGYYHFSLARMFGDIIIKTTPTRKESDAYNGKSSREEVYRQILQDLEEAATKLPSYSASLAKGRVSREAALAMAAKAALYAENWALALQKSKEVINSNKYYLLPNVSDVYNVARKDLARNEVIFYFESNANVPPGFRHALGDLAGPPNSAGKDYGGNTFGSWFAYQSFYDSFNPADKRRQLLDTFYINRNNQIVSQRNITPITTRAVLIKKYMDPNAVGRRFENLVPILRLADVYLIAAEAEARLNGPTPAAYDFINVIRRRAGLADLTVGLSAGEFIKAVLQERSWEFFAEGDRWYDLTRTNTFMEAVKSATNNVYPDRSNVQPKHRYFPIPFSEILANPALKQNPDWE